MHTSIRLWVAGSVLAGVLTLPGCAGEPSPPRAEAGSLPDSLEKLKAAMLRKKYPFVSVAGRLQYEVAKAQRRTEPKLTGEAAQALEETERNLQWGRHDLRVRSLMMLHESEVGKFVDREGQGVSRMDWIPSLDLVELPATPPIPFEPAPDLSEDETDLKVDLPKRPSRSRDGPDLPGLDALGRFHRGGLEQFAGPWTNGLVKGRHQVAGFEPHQFTHMPEVPRPAPQVRDEKWLIARLELVSLLKHEQPAVYVSEHLPRMDALKAAKTRPLSAFEEKALKALQQGDDLFTEATLNRIHMMGALRAAKQCLDCHNVPRGDLLGTFSYELRRDPPVRGEE